MAVRSREEFSDEGEISDSDDIAEPIQQKTTGKHEGGRIWSAMIQAEDLETGLKSMPIDDSNKPKMVERDAESFPAPQPEDFKLPKIKKQKPKRLDNSDDLFGGGGDTGAEEFGVRTTTKVRTQPEVKSANERINHLNSKDQRRWKRFQRGKHGQAPETAANFMPNRKRQIQEAESMDSLNSVSTEHSEASSHSCFPPKSKKKRKRNKVQENAILRSDFSFEHLYTASIPTGLSVEQTGERLAKELGDQDPTPIKFAVNMIGIELALELFDATIETEKNGGLQVKFGNRRRTPGGVFFKHLHESSQISDEMKKQIYDFSRDYTANKKKNAGNEAL